MALYEVYFLSRSKFRESINFFLCRIRNIIYINIIVNIVSKSIDSPCLILYGGKALLQCSINSINIYFYNTIFTKIYRRTYNFRISFIHIFKNILLKIIIKFLINTSTNIILNTIDSINKIMRFGFK